MTQRASPLTACWSSCSGSPQLSHLLSINFWGPLRMTQTFLSSETFQVLKGYLPGTGDRPAQFFITQDTDSRICILYRRFFPFLREIITKNKLLMIPVPCPGSWMISFFPLKCIFFSFVAQSYPTVYNPLDCHLIRSSVHGISHARIRKWVAISFSRGSSQFRDWTWVSCASCIACRFFTNWATREALLKCNCHSSGTYSSA